jgi:hypothetical protein
VTRWEISELASTDLEIRLEAYELEIRLEAYELELPQEIPRELPREIWQTPQGPK